MKCTEACGNSMGSERQGKSPASPGLGQSPSYCLFNLEVEFVLGC